MKKFKRKATLLTVFLLLTSCYSSTGYAPKDVKGLTVSYYLEKVGGVFDNDILHKTVAYEYKTNGTYVAYVDGKFFEEGDYTFHSENPNRVEIMLTYSDEKNIYLYAFVMNYESNSSGNWHAILSNNPDVQHSEGGTFKQGSSGQ